MRAGDRLPGAHLVDRRWATPGVPSRCFVEVAYRTNISIRDRSGAIFAVVAIHVLLALWLLNLSGRMDLSNGESVMRVFNLAPPPPPPPPRPQQKEPLKPKKDEGASAPLNIKSEASMVMAPKPKVEIPPVPQIVASETPSSGAEATQGASTIEGPGTGAGGSGTGTGNGGSGGGGGDNGIAQAPRLITPVLTGKDFPNSLLSSWPKGGTVFVRLRVDEHGLVSECAVDHGSGLAPIDSEICALAHDRLKFSPAVNRSGQAVAGWFGYAQRAPR